MSRSEAIRVPISRRVRPVCEAEFQQAVSESFQAVFGYGGVLGASLFTSPPDSDSREYGILRTIPVLPEWPPVKMYGGYGTPLNIRNAARDGVPVSQSHQHHGFLGSAVTASRSEERV